MRLALPVCLLAVAGCSGHLVDLDEEQAALKGGNSCHIDHVKYERGQSNPTNACQVCDPQLDDKGWSAADCTPTSAVIGANGGTLTTSRGVSLEIPAGAVDADTLITVTPSATPPPAGSVTPVFDFSPNGIVFAHPVKVVFPLASSAGALSTFWTSHDGSGRFEPIGGTVVGNTMVVDVSHFCSGYVASDPGKRTISGSQKDTWISATTIQSVAADLSAVPVEAFVANGSGGYTSYPGTGLADGDFWIANVPDGPALVRVGNRYTTVDVATCIDLGIARLGRFDQTAVSAGTSLVFNVSMDMSRDDAWRDGDSLEFFCTQVDTWYFNIEQYGTPNLPVAGATSLVNMPLDYSVDSNGQPAHLIQGISKGDTCTLAHLQARQTLDATPVAYTAMAETFTPAPFDQLDGALTTLDGAFTSNDTPSPVSVDLHMQEFPPLHGNDPAGAVRALTIDAFFVTGEPADPTHGIEAQGATADFLILDLSSNPQRTLATNMKYGEPLSGSWETLSGAVSQYVYLYTLPDGPNRAASMVETVATHVDLPSDGSIVTVVPLIGPPGSAQINGLDLKQPQSGVGATPTLTWSAPSLGTPDLYVVDIVHLVPSNGGTFKQTSAHLATSGTSMTLPAGILTVGERYVFSIRAIHNGAPPDPTEQEATAVPFRFGARPDTANVLSGIITP